MIKAAAICFLLSLVAAILGWGDLATPAATAGRVLFFLFLGAAALLFVIEMVGQRRVVE